MGFSILYRATKAQQGSAIRALQPRRHDRSRRNQWT